MKIFGKYVRLVLLGGIILSPCFVNAGGESWKQRACQNNYTDCGKVSENYKEPYCITNDEGNISSANNCAALSFTNKFSFREDMTMKNLLENYCSLLYKNSDEGRIYFAKPANQLDSWDWQQTFDSHQSLFLYALCSSFKKDGNMVFLNNQNVSIDGVFTGNLAKLLKLQQISDSGKDLCSLDDSDSLDDCDMSIYATKIYDAIMTDLYKIKYAQVLDVNTSKNFKKDEKVENFMSGYMLSNDEYKKIKEDYPKTVSILESNQMFYNGVLGTLKIIDNSNLADLALKSGCPLDKNMTGIDFVACALHSSQGNGFANSISFVTLLYNEILHYRQFVMYHDMMLSNMVNKKSGLNVNEKEILLSKISDLDWFSEKQLDATKGVQHDFEEFNMTYPLHIGLLMYTEKVEKFRNGSLSKVITSFYSLSEKLQNVQQPKK